MSFDPEDGLPRFEEFVQRIHPADQAQFSELIQAGGEIIAPQAVHLRRPDVENAEWPPIANLGRREVFVVERWRCVRNVHSVPRLLIFSFL
jgi:hypothetical protein